MSIYNVNGSSISSAYNLGGTVLSDAFDVNGTSVYQGGDEDYDKWTNEYEHAILQARDAWKTQYRADPTIIPLVLHTDQHNAFRLASANSVNTFTYLGKAIKWSEVSAMIGLGDVDLSQANYPQMNTILNYAVDRTKQINLWGNHDLWQWYTTVDGQYVIDFDGSYTYFGNDTYGDVSHAYNHKGIEYHIDRAHNVKYVCLAGWEIDANLGGYSHYVIGSESMEGIIDMLEMVDDYDIILLSHCCPFKNIGDRFWLGEGGTSGSDVLYPNGAQQTTDAINEPVVHIAQTSLDDMILARINRTSGTIKDSYGNVHSYDFTNTRGNIICSLMGHWHRDGYGYSTSGGICCIDFDAFAYGSSPFYLVNIDRTNHMMYGWKITSNALQQSYSVPLIET